MSKKNKNSIKFSAVEAEKALRNVLKKTSKGKTKKMKKIKNWEHLHEIKKRKPGHPYVQISGSDTLYILAFADNLRIWNDQGDHTIFEGNWSLWTTEEWFDDKPPSWCINADIIETLDSGILSVELTDLIFSGNFLPYDTRREFLISCTPVGDLFFLREKKDIPTEINLFKCPGFKEKNCPLMNKIKMPCTVMVFANGESPQFCPHNNQDKYQTEWENISEEIKKEFAHTPNDKRKR